MTTEEKNFQTYMPIGFWSGVVSQMDSQIKNMALTSGYGEVSARVIVQSGTVVDVVYGQENRIRQIKPPPPPEKKLNKP